jgi:hypothetical protein
VVSRVEARLTTVRVRARPGVAITIGAGKDGGYRTRSTPAVQILITHRILEHDRKDKQARQRRIARCEPDHDTQE